MEYIIDGSENNIQSAKEIIKEVIAQAQNGVTDFSIDGILGNVLYSLDLRPYHPCNKIN